MTTILSRRFTFTILAAALAAALLLAPAAQADQPIPTLKSTAQYKALVSYVAKLRTLRDRPATAARKDAYTSELTSKHGDAVAKSTALFNRAKRDAGAESQDAVKAGTQKLRRAAADALASIRDESADKLVRAGTSYVADLATINSTYDIRFDAFRKQIEELRKKKAMAKGLDRKTKIQAQINTIIDQVSANKRQQFSDLADRKDRYIEEKRAIQDKKASDVAEVQGETQETVGRLQRKQKRIYDRAVAALQVKRANQVSDLEAKLNTGRVYISLMPLIP